MSEPVQGFIWLGVILIVYFFPTIVAKSRHVENAAPTFIVNLFLGWTLIGWVIALAMGAGASTKAKTSASGATFTRDLNPLTQVADAISSGTRRPIGTGRVIGPKQLPLLGVPDATKFTTVNLANGDAVEVYERHGSFVMVRTPSLMLGWLPEAQVSVQMAPSDTKVCPQCAETIQAAARICRFCRYDFAAALA